jgi:hypothetical protein
MLQDCDLSLLQVYCILSKRQEILCKKKEEERKRRKKEREKEKSMISMPRSSSLSSKEEIRYLKTSTAKFFINSSVGGSLSRSKVELG